jgi:cation/acetate symporter
MALVLFGIIVMITLGITFWASRRLRTTSDYYAAGRQITGFQNGIAVAGDYMSAASFLGIAGLIAFNGYDGFLYSVGWLVAYLTVLLLIAEPLRNTGKYTMADVLAYRLKAAPVRSAAALSTLTVSTFYLVAQMVGAGSLVNLLIPQLSYELSVLIIGVLIVIYVVFGGMLATTWVQIIKAVLLMAGTIVLSIMVLSQFGFNLFFFFDRIAEVKATVGGREINFTQPGILYNGQWGALDLISLGMALILGTAGLPHILMRFYTVPTAKAARTSVVWAMVLIGVFYIMTTFLGFGAAVLVGKANIGVPRPDGTIAANNNLAAPLLAQFVGGGANTFGGQFFLAFIGAVAFATILAVVAGLTIAASSAFAHDFWLHVVKKGREDEREQVRVARLTSIVVGLLAIAFGIVWKGQNVAYLVALAFAVASSANLPVILLALYWRRFTTAGAVTGLLTGLAASIFFVIIGPSVMGAGALFPLANPGIVSIPIGFLGAWLGSVLSREPTAEALYPELLVRAHTGLGAER